MAINKYEQLVNTVVNGIYISDYKRVTKVSVSGKKYSVGYLTVALDEQRDITLDITLDQWKNWNFIKQLRKQTNTPYSKDVLNNFVEDLINCGLLDLEKLDELFCSLSLAQGLAIILEEGLLKVLYKGKRIVNVYADTVVTDIVVYKKFNPKELYLNPQFNEIVPLWDLFTEKQQMEFENGTFDIEELGNELLKIYADDDEVISSINYEREHGDEE